MTNVVTVKVSTVFGNKVIKIASIDITSYTTGGEVVNASALGLNEIDGVSILGHEEPTTQYVTPELNTTGDYASGSSFQLFATNLDGTNAETTSTTDVGTVGVMVIGHR